MKLRQTFSKDERISSRKEIDFLFSEGSSFCVFPLRVIYAKKEKGDGKSFAVFIGISKKKIKRAVLRNRLKRLIRETYRLNKQLLEERKQMQSYRLLIAFLFTGNETVSYKEIEMALIKALTQLNGKLQ